MSKKIIQLNEGIIKDELKELVRNSVEETLNGLLDQEAEELTKAGKYERTQERRGYRAGHYDRNLTTTSGDVTLKMPKLKGLAFETAIIERYQRRESSVEEALIEMYLAGVSVRRVEDITEALWGSKVSPGTISNLNKKAYVHIEDWRNRPLTSERYPYVYVDGIYLKRNWGGEYESIAILIAVAVNDDGYREVIGAAEGMKEDKASWYAFFQSLKERGLSGVKLIIGDKCLGLLEAAAEVFPYARYQRCTVHFYRNIFSAVPRSKMRVVVKMLKAIHAQESKKSAREKAKSVGEELRKMKLAEAAKKLESGIEETLSYMDFPYEHWSRIRTTNMIERINREIKRRTKVVGTFPDGNSALMLVCANEIWTHVEFVGKTPDVSQSALVRYFKKADKRAMMSDEENGVLVNLPEKVTVYRGVQERSEKSIKGLSWTLDIDVAKWFASRLGQEGYVYESIISKEHILAYFGQRGESETVVDPNQLHDVKLIETIEKTINQI